MIICSSVLLVCKTIRPFFPTLYFIVSYLYIEPFVVSFATDRSSRLDPIISLDRKRMQFSSVHVRLYGPQRAPHVETAVS